MDSSTRVPRIVVMDSFAIQRTITVPGFGAKFAAGRARVVILTRELFDNLKPDELVITGDTIAMTSPTEYSIRTYMVLEWG